MRTTIKLSAVLFAILCFSIVASAGDRQISVRAGIGGSPLSAGIRFPISNVSSDLGSGTLASYYGRHFGPVYTCGVLNAGVDIRLLKWLAVSADINCTPVWCDEKDWEENKIGRKSGASLTVLPSAKFYYFRRPVICLYGSAGIGLGAVINSPDRNMCFECQFVPIGFELGRNKWFWYTEVGFGSAYCGARTGVGYRF